MNKRISFGLGLMFAGLVIFIITFNFFYIVSAILEFIFYLSSLGALGAGIHEIILAIQRARSIKQIKNEKPTKEPV